MEQDKLEALQRKEKELLEKLNQTEADIETVEKAIGEFLAQNPYAETQLPGNVIKVLNYKKNAKKTLLTQLQEVRAEMESKAE